MYKGIVSFIAVLMFVANSAYNIATGCGDVIDVLGDIVAYSK